MQVWSHEVMQQSGAASQIEATQAEHVVWRGPPVWHLSCPPMLFWLHDSQAWPQASPTSLTQVWSHSETQQ